MPRLSIRTLMVCVVIAAIGLAAVTSPNDFWADLMILIDLSAVVAAIPIALFSQSKRRAWWAGFAVFCGCYLMSSNAPGVSQLTTTRALKYVILLAKQPDSRWRTLLPGTVNQAEFIRVGHAVLALLVGLVGGTAMFVLGRLVAIGLTVAGLAMSGIRGWQSERQIHVWRTSFVSDDHRRAVRSANDEPYGSSAKISDSEASQPACRGPGRERDAVHDLGGCTT